MAGKAASKGKKGVKNYLYRDNLEYHNREKRRSRERYQKDPAYKKATLERARNRYHEDEEYRAATIKRAKERYRRLKQNEKSRKNKSKN